MWERESMRLRCIPPAVMRPEESIITQLMKIIRSRRWICTGWSWMEGNWSDMKWFRESRSGGRINRKHIAENMFGRRESRCRWWVCRLNKGTFDLFFYSYYFPSFLLSFIITSNKPFICCFCISVGGL